MTARHEAMENGGKSYSKSLTMFLNFTVENGTCEKPDIDYAVFLLKKSFSKF